MLQRAVALTPEPARRADRALAAAQAHLQAGAFDAALALLPAAEAGAVDDLQRARLDLLRGQIAFASGVGREAPPLLLKAAERLEPLDVELARDTYLDAWGAALFAGGWRRPAACSRSPRRPGRSQRRAGSTSVGRAAGRSGGAGHRRTMSRGVAVAAIGRRLGSG